MSFGSLARVGSRFSDGLPSLEPERGPSLESAEDLARRGMLRLRFVVRPSLEPEKELSLKSVEDGPEQPLSQRTMVQVAEQVYRLAVSTDLSHFHIYQ